MSETLKEMHARHAREIAAVSAPNAPTWAEQAAEIATLRQRLADAESRAASEWQEAVSMGRALGFTQGVEEAAREADLEAISCSGSVCEVVVNIARAIRALLSSASTEGRCPVCSGSGSIAVGASTNCGNVTKAEEWKCHKCGGTGRVDGKEGTDG